jgi:hypothetical protein
MKNNGDNMNDIRKEYPDVTSYKAFNSDSRLLNGVSYWYLNDLSKGGNLGNWVDRIKFIEIVIPEKTTEYISRKQLNDFDTKYGKSIDTLTTAIKKTSEAIKRLGAIKESLDSNPPHFIKCYRMEAPKYHVAIGDIFTTSDKALLDYEGKYVCIPDHCYRKVRDWDANDIIYNGDKFNIYYNPYTHTLHGDNSGYVGKIIACPNRDFMSDVLINNDKSIREACDQHKKVIEATPIIPDGAFAQEMDNMETQIFDQAVKINKLKQYSKELSDTNMKSNVINQEHNRKSY